MDKKTALKIFIAVLFIALIIIGFLIFFQKKTGNQTSVSDTARNIFGSFFPTESNPLQPAATSSLPESSDNQNNTFKIPRLRQISTVPTAGGVMFERSATTSSLLVQEETGTEANKKITEVVYRYVERATGNIYETTARDLSQKRITNTTVPKVYEAYFDKRGDDLAMLYLDKGSIENFLAKINYPQIQISTTTQEEVLENFANITGTFLPLDSFGFTTFGTSTFAFINTVDSENGEVFNNLYISDFKKPLEYKKVVSLPSAEWKVQVLNNNSFAVTTKPSSIAEGFLYFVSPTEGLLKKKLGNILGLTTLVSPDQKKILFSYYDSGNTKMAIYDFDAKTYTTLGVSTIVADKCIWSRKETGIVYCALPTNLVRGNFPDGWYTGQYSFNDGIAKIDAAKATMSYKMPANTETEQNLDMTSLQLSPNEDYLLFRNKNDLTLWSLDLLN